MKITLVYKIVSIISLLFALMYYNEFFKEIANGTSIFEFDFKALVLTFFTIINTTFSILCLIKYLKPNLIILIFQILITILTGWALYEIYTFEKPEIIDCQTVA